MPLVKVIPHGNLGEPLVLEASTVAEAIEAWSLQSPLCDIPTMERPVLEVVGYETREQMQAQITTDELHVMPAMFGGGGFGKILLGAAMIGVTFIPGIGTALGIGTKLLTAIQAAGIGMALGGVMQLFMKTPRTLEDPESSKVLGSGKNTTQIGTTIGMGGGRMMVGGQYLSLQVNASDLVSGTFPATP